MKGSKTTIDQAVERPDPKIRLFLLAGQDQAKSRALAATLLKALGAAKYLIPADQLKTSPGLLLSEASALNLFGEKRLVWIEPASNDIAAAADALLAAERVESPVVAIAGALAKGSALLKLAEASPLALAFTAYAPSGNEAANVVQQLGRAVGLSIAPEIASRLAESCGNDQGIAARELDKLALFLDASTHSPKVLDPDALDAVGAGTGDGNSLRLADRALAGDLRGLAEELASRSAGADDHIPVLRALQRRLLALAPLRARVERGERPRDVMTSSKNAIFFKDEPLFRALLGKWNAAEIARAAERIGKLERAMMFTKAPEAAALEQELLAIARKAASRAA